MSDANREAVMRVLAAEGGEPGNSLHSWRCEYPDRYGPCTCLADTADEIVKALDLDARDQAAEKRGAAKALRDLAAKWQMGQWADAPRLADRVQERIANAQHVTDWLNAHADRIEGGDQ